MTPTPAALGRLPSSPSRNSNSTPLWGGGFLLPSRHWGYKWLAILAGLIALARAASTVGTFNHTIDEMAHIAGAVGLYEAHHNVYMIEHPPLQRLVVGAALKIAGVEYPPARGLKVIPKRDEANVAGEQILFHGKVPYWRVLIVGRLAVLVFAAALLAYIYWLGSYLAGPLVGMLASVFFSLDPTLLGHAGFIATDVPAAAGFVAATYHALRFVGHPSGRTAVVAGLALGLGMACKFTCVMLVPPVLLLIAIRAMRHARRVGGDEGASSRRSLRRRPGFLSRAWHHVPKLRYFVVIALVAFVALWATYLFHVGRLSEQHLFEQEKTWQKIPQWAKTTPIPMPAMPLGLMFMAVLGKYGFPGYFNGQLGYTGHLAYFPTVLAFKLPTAAVVAAVWAVLAMLGMFRRVRPILTLCVVLPPSVLFLTAATGKLQIGIRHILPVLPFIYLFAALQMRRGVWTVGLLLLIAWAAIEGGAAHPDYMSFYNRLSGGPVRGVRVVADSNVDWGQDVARLAEYLKSTGRPYHVLVSGARVPALLKFLGLDERARIRGDAERDWTPELRPPGTDAEEIRKHPTGLFAIGVNAKLGFDDLRRTEDGEVIRGPDWAWLDRYPVVKRIGNSITVYDLDVKE